MRREFIRARDADPVQKEVTLIRNLIFRTTDHFTTKAEFIANLPMLSEFFDTVGIRATPYDEPTDPDPYYQALYREPIKLLTESLFMAKIMQNA